MGKVFASVSTWLRLVRIHGWPRPRARVHPAKPKVGVRAKKPNEIWHLDVTILRLLDGTRLYLHAVVDNFSRCVLAWQLEEELSPVSTCEVLAKAAQELKDATSSMSVVTDSGSENVNETVDGFLASMRLERILAGRQDGDALSVDWFNQAQAAAALAELAVAAAATLGAQRDFESCS